MANLPINDECVPGSAPHRMSRILHRLVCQNLKQEPFLREYRSNVRTDIASLAPADATSLVKTRSVAMVTPKNGNVGGLGFLTTIRTSTCLTGQAVTMVAHVPDHVACPRTFGNSIPLKVWDENQQARPSSQTT